VNGLGCSTVTVGGEHFALGISADTIGELIGGFFHFSERENNPEPENQYETRFDFANRWLYRSQRIQIHKPGSFTNSG
jgi:hypothetical protein